MLKISWPLLLILFLSCVSKPRDTGILAATCAPTAIRESDLKQFGFKPVVGKIGVMRVFATWCPFCKLDLAHIGDRFRTGDWSTEKVQLFLLAYRTHGENRDTVEAFQREDLKNFGIPEGAAQVVFVDKDLAQMHDLVGQANTPLFAGLAGLPFALIFGKDWRLAFRGHFTASDAEEKRHYDFITKLEAETCSVEK